jgi:hypothetical protein
LPIVSPYWPTVPPGDAGGHPFLPPPCLRRLLLHPGRVNICRSQRPALNRPLGLILGPVPRPGLANIFFLTKFGHVLIMHIKHNLNR